jgi:phosphoribosyl 1,2-cyclic phosphodiesterase
MSVKKIFSWPPDEEILFLCSCMSLYVASLNSGSNGNCYYLGNETEAILVDAGISCREIEKRMKRLGLSIKKIKAVFVSHEHIDHIKGVAVLAKKYQLPVYITTPTLRSGGLYIEKSLVKSFLPHQPVSIGGLAITAFPKFHDAIDPYSFSVTNKNVTVGVFTDVGKACDHLVRHFKQCHAAFLETNYDDEMLENGSYPYHLKKRIKSETGHLSNAEALELFVAHRPVHMTHLFLSHLSRNNNSAELVQQLFHHHANGVKIILASRWEETAVYQISGGQTAPQNFILRTEQLKLSF